MKARFRNVMLKWLLSLLTAVSLGLGAGCEGVHASGTVTFFDYDYYPDWDVYFYPTTQVYFWNDGRHWRSGRALPRDYRLNTNRRSLHLTTRQPWTQNWPDQPRFRSHYPPRRW